MEASKNEKLQIKTIKEGGDTQKIQQPGADKTKENPLKQLENDRVSPNQQF